MSLSLTADEQAIAAGRDGKGAAMAMRIVAEAARLLGAPRLIPIASAHIDGALYHGDSGTLFAEALVEGDAKVAVRSTLNVGALDLMGCSRVRLEEPMRSMARRMMDAYRKLGCEQSWTCAPYQAGHRPGSEPMSPGANPTPSCSAIPCSARAPTAMAIFSTSPARSPAARRTTACTGREIAVHGLSST